MSTVGADSGDEEVVRINARKLADGRIEFGLQQRLGAGWAARVLPEARFFPTDAAIGRWLYSTPFTVAVPLPIAKQLTLEPDWRDASGTNRAVYKAGETAFGFRTQIQVTGDTSDPHYNRANLILTCDEDDSPGHISVAVALFSSHQGRPTEYAPLDRSRSHRLRLLFGSRHKGVWEPWGEIEASGSVDFAYVDDGDALWDRMQAERFLSISLPVAGSADVVAAFDTRGVFGTNVQKNFEDCPYDTSVFRSETRIAARRIADGRVEFGLQQQTPFGWTAPILPKSRYFPVDANQGQWLSSRAAQLAAPHINVPIVMAGHDPDTRVWHTTSNSSEGVSSYVSIWLMTSHERYDWMSVRIACEPGSLGQLTLGLMIAASRPVSHSSFGEFSVIVPGLYETLDLLQEDGDFQLTRVDGWSQASFAIGTDAEARPLLRYFYPPQDGQLYHETRYSETSLIEDLYGEDRVRVRAEVRGRQLVEASFDPSLLLQSAIQANLDWCGEY